jgi:hypothetical protein
VSVIAPAVRPPAVVGKTIAGVAAIVTLDAAVLVLVFGVLVTTGVYGSRLAWLFGVTLPLLAITMALSRLSSPPPHQVDGDAFPALRSRRDRLSRAVFLAAFSLFALPFALALLLLASYALAFAVLSALHGVSPVF